MAATLNPRVQASDAGPQAAQSGVIVFDKVSLAFDDKVILDQVSFTLAAGDMKIILGASGAGKSTILRLVLGLLKPDGGQIFVNTYGAGGGVELPFGGFRKSGYGREKGVEAMDAYTATKTIVVQL